MNTGPVRTAICKVAEAEVTRLDPGFGTSPEQYYAWAEIIEAASQRRRDLEQRAMETVCVFR